MSKKYKCKNVECHETFTWPMQLAKHKTKCKYPEPVIQKNYKLDEGTHQCLTCFKEFRHQASATRHNSKKKKKNSEYKCNVCSKVFLY